MLGRARQVAGSPYLTSSLKRLFLVVSNLNTNLYLQYISSRNNPADRPLRTLSLQGAKHFGGHSGHTIDLMALPSNAQSYLSGLMYLHSTRRVILSSFWITMLSLLLTSSLNCSVSFPRSLSRVPSWYLMFFLVLSGAWPLLPHSHAFPLAKKWEKGVVLPPTPKGFLDTWSLPWDLWIFRFEPIVWHSIW